MSPQHGTGNSYNQGCRCDACTAANRERVREWRHRSGRNRPFAEWQRIRPRGPQTPHGTANRYFKHGCRCGPCTKAASAERQRYRDAAALQAEAHG